MAYSKEYYEEHKDSIKRAREKYINKNREEINKKQRDRYNSLSQEEKEERIKKQREKRAENGELSKIQYRIDCAKRFLKKYERKMFDLQMTDTWDSFDYKYSDELNRKIIYYKGKIEELQKEKEKLSGKV